MKSSNDIRNYADYIFGTMPLLFKGTGMKVHTSKSVFALLREEEDENSSNFIFQIAITNDDESNFCFEITRKVRKFE